MCLAKVYLDEGKGPFLEEVANLQVEGDRLRFWTLFGEERELEADIKEIDFQNSKILLRSPVEK